jgi:hypothetical protein
MRGNGGKLHAFLNSALDRAEWSGHFTPMEEPSVFSESEVRACVDIADKRRIFGLQEIAGNFQSLNRNPSNGDLPLQVSN